MSNKFIMKSIFITVIFVFSCTPSEQAPNREISELKKSISELKKQNIELNSRLNSVSELNKELNNELETLRFKEFSRIRESGILNKFTKNGVLLEFRETNHFVTGLFEGIIPLDSDSTIFVKGDIQNFELYLENNIKFDVELDSKSESNLKHRKPYFSNPISFNGILFSDNLYLESKYLTTNLYPNEPSRLMFEDFDLSEYDLIRYELLDKLWPIKLESEIDNSSEITLETYLENKVYGAGKYIESKGQLIKFTLYFYVSEIYYSLLIEKSIIYSENSINNPKLIFYVNRDDIQNQFNITGEFSDLNFIKWNNYNNFDLQIYSRKFNMIISDEDRLYMKEYEY
jgi:hypothetical protein